MSFSAELISLLLYSLQQLGVMLGVGAETIMLLAYLISMRDGTVDKTEDRFSHAVGRVLDAGLILIIVSGIGVVTTHFIAREYAILFAPVFMFKWVLIGIIVLSTVLIQNKIFSQARLEMLAGGTWYAIFIVHILAPITTWSNLILLYAVWILGFSLCWYGLTRFTRESSVEAAKPLPHQVPPPVIKKVSSPPLPSVALAKEGPKPIPPPPPKLVSPPPKPIPPPPPPKPIAPLPKPVPPLQPARAPIVAPAALSSGPKLVPPLEHFTSAGVSAPVPAPAPQPKKPDESPFLPSIRIMPKTVEDVEKHKRATMVNFD
ncbi:MAG: hypothetical protein AAB449_02300 [Patescibacteria group bacterium]